MAEWGDAREAFGCPDAIAALAGITPVTKASGKQRGVSFRWVCNKRLRLAITTFAVNSRVSRSVGGQGGRALRARTTRMPSASWLAPGSGSYGAAGRTARPTTPPCTAAPDATTNSRPQPDCDLEVDTRRVMRLVRIWVGWCARGCAWVFTRGKSRVVG
nr:transposase [Amycolatopsis taiwanensis]